MGRRADDASMRDLGSLAMVVLLFLLTGCDLFTGPVGLGIEVKGRLERSLTIELQVNDAGEPVQPSLVQWSAEPPDAIEFMGGDRAVLLRAGEVRIEARTETKLGARTIEVAVPPLVFFDMARGGNRDIYRVALDGKDLARITENPAADLDPSVAVGAVVFTSLRDGNRELYSITSTGGALRRLTQTAASEENAALSADGQRLAYVSNATGVFRLWTARSDGSNAAPATGDFGGSGAIERDPSWAPSGERLAFMSTANGTADLFEWNEGEISPVVTTAGVEVEPAWNPDGGRLLFAADRDGETAAADLLVADLSTSQETRLTDRPGNEGQPAWTPDGRVIFTRFTGDRSELQWLDPGSSEGAVAIPLDGESPENAAVERNP